MQINKINNTSFNGKAEIRYGLENSAKIAKKIEDLSIQYIGPHPHYSDAMLYMQKGKLHAYTDMILNDNSLNTALPEIMQDNGFITKLKSILTPNAYRKASTTPSKIFTDEFRLAMKDNINAKSKTVDKDILSSFFDIIE